MNAKKFCYGLLIVFFLFCTCWIGSKLITKHLTIHYGSEFINIEAFSQNDLHPWNREDFQLRVLSYSDNRAVVYYYSECGGEKIEFFKNNHIWQYGETLAIWSAQGLADDYLIWPYYKNFVS